jgi:NADPH:quinone reductase-like Zn-dependent oxidoreductase
MKAAVVHDFTQPLSIEDVPTPEAGDGQVLVVRIDGLCHSDIQAEQAVLELADQDLAPRRSAVAISSLSRRIPQRGRAGAPLIRS